MKNSIRKFLEFNGKVIYYLSKDGEYWIAVKPICEALGINYNRQQQNIRKDEILSQLCAVQHIVAADIVRQNAPGIQKLAWTLGRKYKLREQILEMVDKLSISTDAINRVSTKIPIS